jgi:5-carboxymethyl-2-hydroxymuconate isomerase
MPHITIEHPQAANKDIKLNKLSQSLHNYLAEHDTINKSAIKTRTVQVSNVYVGEDETENLFVHITILLLAGRSQDLKDTIVRNVFDRTKTFIPANYILSVETRDLGTYCKG